MDAPGLIRKKRDGQALSREEIFDFVSHATHGDIPDYQVSALLMAIYFRGLDTREIADLTGAMTLSGVVLDWPEVSLPKADKHSTGGVGDKTSLVIAPVAAAGGLAVPMVSGRGLGHTGGTLDKLDAIPGFNTRLSIKEFRRIVAACGLGLIGQTEEFATADRKFYALRDVTATVESLPLICASILSKKIAEGLDVLVLDVKTGSGAFMKKLEDSRALAERMVEIGSVCGVKTQALITDMNQPLGNAVGNSLEVIECLETLKGRGPRDLVELSRELTARMFVMARVETTLHDARARFDSIIASGKGIEKFAQVIEAQGGDARVVDDYSRLPDAQFEDAFVAPEDGTLVALEAEAIGRASMALGAGRERLDSVIDPGVGIVLEKKVGDPVSAGERICTLYVNDRSRLARARQMLANAIKISLQCAQSPKLIVAEVPSA